MKKLARCKHEGTEEEAVDNVAQGSSTSLSPVGHPYKGNSKNNLSLIGVEVDLIMNCKGGNRVQAVAAASTYRAGSRVMLYAGRVRELRLAPSGRPDSSAGSMKGGGRKGMYTLSTHRRTQRKT